VSQLKLNTSSRAEARRFDLFGALLALIMLCTLLQNRVPELAAAGIVVFALMGIVARLVGKAESGRIEWALVACLAYWLLNYSWTGAGFGNLVSYDFLRRDGALLVAYPAFFGFLAWRRDARRLQAFWIVVLVVLSVIAAGALALRLHIPHPGLLDSLEWALPDQNTGYVLLYGFFESHNTSGGVWAEAAIMALALLQDGRIRPRYRPFVWLLLLCCLTGLAFTYSRSGYLGFVTGAAIIVPLRKFSKTLRIGMLLGLPVVVLLLSSSTLMERIDSITDPYYGTNASRLQMWQDALEDIAWSPIVGIGFGRYNDPPVEFKGVKNLVWIEVEGIIKNEDSHAHNSYLHFLAEGGVIGLFVTLYIWWCAWTELSFFESKFSKSDFYWLCRAAKGSMAVVFVSALTEHMLGKGSVALVSMALIGMTVAASRREWAKIRQATTYQPDLLTVRTSSVRVEGRPVAVK
jgi:O-antigen ligase